MTRTCAAFVLLICAGLGAQTPVRDRPASSSGVGGAVRGRVVAAQTGDPLRNALVHLGTAQENFDPAITDGDGRFTFEAMPAGRYGLDASKAGYARAQFGGRAAGPRVLIEVTAGTTVDGIELRMERGAAITGRVVDDRGDPLPGLSVAADRVVRVDGRTDLIRIAQTETDDLGEYRLGGLAAGRFVVAVVSAPARKCPGSTSSRPSPVKAT
jgi:hypothetical protein